MGSIYKRKGSSVWQAAFYVPDPINGLKKQIRRSTGESSRKEALNKAVLLEEQALAEAGAGGDKARRIQAVLTRAGEEAVRETLNAARARMLLGEIVRISTGEDMPSFTILTWIEEWLGRKEREVSPATVARYRASLGAFLRWLGENAGKPLESLVRTSVLRFRESIRSEGRAARTCNHYVKDLAGCLRTAMEEGLLGYNPAIGIKPLLLDDSIPREPFSREEVLALVEAATSEDWKGAVLFGAFTGLRLGDIASLSWGAVDLAAGMIRVTPKKTRRTKKEVVIPIHPELADFLERHPIGENRDEAPVFPSLDGVGTSGGKGLSAQFVAIMKLAGVSRGESSRSGGEEGGEGEAAYRVGRVVYARGFHSLRHTFTSWLAKEDIPEDQRMLLTGHSDVTVHRGYTHHQIETLARSLKKVPGLKEEDTVEHNN